MSNRRFEQFRFSLEKKVVDLYLRVSVAAAGAPTLVRGKGIASIAKNGTAGQYVIRLGTPATITDAAYSDTYQMLLDADCAVIVSTGAAAPIMNIISDNSATTGLIVVQFNSASGGISNVYPAAGEILMIRLTLSNSSSA